MNRSLLLFQAGTRTCALPAQSVREILRPLAVEPLPDAPAFVLGASIVRGLPLAILDVGALLSGVPTLDGRRWITADTGAGRQVGLHVTRVRGVHSVSAADLHEVPALLEGADNDSLEALGRRDGALLSLLRLGRVLPAELLDRLAEREDRS